ncbi:S8 family peptidase [Chryseosolibacter indicus]|uniref:S8 family peptidase n=1 Tax=Chryseosolibacter indicus TaxID=2782351 RepID=A0ABS5VV38_9BACT|nr:S8 family peptidase [Chryseosolibacter indicus]MBT1705297.1 S8 family peptidase [Chryseosolibacter indicus]
MKNRLAGLIVLLITLLQFQFSHAFQQPDTTGAPPKDWFIRDPGTDSVQGVSAEKTYSTLLKDKPARTVLVAVIDSGIDIEHEDLKDVIWTNEDEIPGNGIDDDKNGYVDDIHGWNFIGGKNGNVNEDTYEVTREYARLKPKYENIDEKKIGKKQKAEYEYWKKVKAKYDNDSKFNGDQYSQYKQQYEMYSNAYQTIEFCDSVLEKATGKPVLKSSLAGVEAKNDTVNFAKQTLMKIMESIDGDLAVKDFLTELDGYLHQLEEGVNHFKVAVEYGYNTEFNSRTVIGDDVNNLNEKGYGNNDVEGPDATHGTHVAGIIAANRTNTIGTKGIADHVKIMSVRAVPNGDERDKDVANAIIYAADNGANIINMSFGKAFSPQKEAVDKAVKYAESKGVLLIHAAGNDGDDLDDPNKTNYPNRNFKSGGQAKNWLEIGASSYGADDEFVGSFSNYGKKSVDLFAPGVQIYSTTPNNAYENLQGTSMACPATSGVAAIIMSYFPDLKAQEVKEILRQSTRKFDQLKVTRPGTKDEQVEFSQLSSTGGLVNAYEAVKLAMEKSNKQAAK